MTIEYNAFREISASEVGETTPWMNISNAPNVTGRYWAVGYVESTGGATGEVVFQIRPRGSAVIVGQTDAMQLDLTATATSLTDNFYVMNGMDVRLLIKTHSGTGKINARVDLGIS